MSRLTTTLVVLVLLLAGCGGGPTTPSVELPRVGDEGGTIDGPDGVVLDVPPGATGDAEFGIDLRASEPPSDEVLEAGESFVGSSYSIRATDAFEVRADGPIVLRVPLPAGVTASDGALRIAVRAPRESYTGEVDPFWHVMPAEVDETGTALELHLYGLPAEALQVAVVTTAAATTGAPASRAAVQPLRTWSDDVSVVLHNASLFGSAAEQQQVREVVRAFALEAIQDYRELGFDAPVWERELIDDTYVLNVQHESKGICPKGTWGTYLNLFAIMYVCYFDEHEEATRFTVNHEAFHAVQNAYLDFAVKPSTRSLWFIEGTAALAERSLATGNATRSPDRYPDIGQGFAKSGGEYTHPYPLQDLWAFLLRSSGLRFTDLIAVMEEANEVSMTSAHRVLTRTPAYADRFGTFAAAYWAYARNQAWERTQDLGDAGQPIAHGEDGIIFDDRPRCAPIDPEGVWPFPVTYRVMDEAFASGQPTLSLDLEPYTFAALRLEVPDAFMASSRARLTVTLKSNGSVLDQRGDARGTIYFGSSCHSSERSTLTVHPWELGATPLVLLVANTHETGIQSVEVSVEMTEVEAPSASGVWAGTYRSDVFFRYGVYGLMCAEVQQTGEALTGTFYQRFDAGDQVFPIEGAVESSRVTFGTLGDQAIDFSGFLTTTGSYMAGSYTTNADDAGEWAAVKTQATSCDTVASPAHGFDSAIGTYHDGRTGSVGSMYVTVWDFQPTKPIYPISFSFTGPETWNDGYPWVVSYRPLNGYSGPWWLWGSRPSVELASGTYDAQATIEHFPAGSRRTIAVDASRVLPVVSGVRAQLSAIGDTVDLEWDQVAGATSYMASLVSYRNGEYDDRRYSTTQETTRSWRVPRSTVDDTYTFAVFVEAFSEHFGDYTLSGRQLDASRSVTQAVEGAEPPVDLNAASSSIDDQSFTFGHDTTPGMPVE